MLKTWEGEVLLALGMVLLGLWRGARRPDRRGRSELAPDRENP